MKTRIPSAGTPLGGFDLLTATSGLWRHYLDRYQDALSNRLHTHCVSVVNSGTTACYVTLCALGRRSSRREVILPAYTAPSLILPIRKAGLIPRLCEVSLETLNLDPGCLDAIIGPDTLCVMPVHMFGLACDIDAIRQVIADRDITVVEDAASSFGTTVQGRETGTLGDVGFLSFNRGKNLSTLVGGVIATDDADLFTLIEEERQALPLTDRLTQLRLLIRLIALAIAVQPIGYTLLYSLISRYKYTALHTDFVSFQFPDVLAGVGLKLLARAEALCARRHAHGQFLMQALDGVSGLRLPAPLNHSYPVFNQFPLLIEDAPRRMRVMDAIFQRTGVEATMLYPEPIHHIYDFGNQGTGDPFPNATFIARHLMLIPTHPLMDTDTLARIATTITETLSDG